MVRVADLKTYRMSNSGTLLFSFFPFTSMPRDQTVAADLHSIDCRSECLNFEPFYLLKSLAIDLRPRTRTLALLELRKPGRRSKFRTVAPWEHLAELSAGAPGNVARFHC